MKYIIRKPFLKIIWLLGVVGIVVLSILPASQLPEIGEISDKIEHFLAYGAISFLGMLAASTNNHRLWLAMVMIFLGLVLEGVQYLLPTRAFETLDGVANTLGVLCALGAYFIYVRVRKSFGG